MRRVYLAQVNYRYGKNTFLPYSVGRLWAYANVDPEIARHYELGGLLFLRDPIPEVIERMEAPDVFGGSCYIWNWRYTTALAKAVKERWPNCLVVLGGPQVPNEVGTFFDDHPYVDVIVQGEGEVAFYEILRERLKGRKHARAVLKPGRMDNLAELPSPYLTGVFDELIKLPYDFHASQETNRGCPYQCTFCDWGSATMSKVRAFPEMIVALEIDWFARNRIELIYNCDANWGMLQQDESITARLIATKARMGWPKQFRAAYSKKVTPRVRRIAKALSDSGMSKGVTLSVQSMNERTLDLVKRKNTSLDDLAALVREYRSQGVPAYTEIILGLPGETYDTFADGLAAILDAGQHESINVYPAISLKNSEMGDPGYAEEHGIRTVEMPMLLLHGSPGHDNCQETYRLVVATKDMPYGDWLRAFLFAWAVQTFHCLGLTRLVAIDCRRHGIGYREFYERLIGWCSVFPQSTIGTETSNLGLLLNRAMAGKPWDTVVHGAGDITWPPEEAAFLHLIRQPISLYTNLRAFLVSNDWPTGAIDLNKRMMIYPRGAFETYAREVVWYGRKGGDFMKPEWVEFLNQAEGGEDESIRHSPVPIHR